MLIKGLILTLYQSNTDVIFKSNYIKVHIC